MSRFTDASLVVVPSLYKASKLYAIKPGTGLADFAVTRSSVKWVLGPNGVLRSVAANTPALEYNTDRTFKGMLVEPAATNSIRNNTNVGAVAGTPGTLPTNWTESLNGLTRQVVATGTENGIEYIDLKFSGTASGTSVILGLESATQIVASNGQIWTESSWFSVVSAPLPPLLYRLNITERTDAGVEVVGESFTFIPTATLTRYSATRTLSGGVTTARVMPRFIFALTNGASYDFTIRIGLPQMETGAVATSVIKTSGTSLTRTADSVTLTGASSLIGQSAGTAFVEVEILNFTQTNARGILYLSDGTTNNRIGIQVAGASDEVQLISSTSGSTLVSIATGNNPSGIQKYAGAYALNDFVFYNNGVLIGIDTSATVPATSRIDIGGIIGTGQFQGWIRSVALFPSRLANATLAALTTL